VHLGLRSAEEAPWGGEPPSLPVLKCPGFCGAAVGSVISLNLGSDQPEPMLSVVLVVTRLLRALPAT